MDSVISRVHFFSRLSTSFPSTSFSFSLPASFHSIFHYLLALLILPSPFLSFLSPFASFIPLRIPLPRYYLYVVALTPFLPVCCFLPSFSFSSRFSHIIQIHLFVIALFHSEKYLTVLDIPPLSDLQLKKRFNLQFSFLLSHFTTTHTPYHTYTRLKWIG